MRGDEFLCGGTVSFHVRMVRQDRLRGAARLESVGAVVNESVVRHAPVMGSWRARAGQRDRD